MHLSHAASSSASASASGSGSSNRDSNDIDPSRPPAFSRQNEGATAAARRTRTVQVGQQRPALSIVFTIAASSGSATAEASLFPEDHPPELRHHAIDLDAYRAAFDQLSAPQKHALRSWCASDIASSGIYHDGTRLITDSTNTDLNDALSTGRPSTRQRDAALQLSLGLSRLPSTAARLSRVVEHGPAHPSPWGTRIQVGDVVTPFPRFISAAHAHAYALQNVCDGDASGLCSKEDTDTLTFLTIDCESGVPLPQGIVSASNEKAWLLQPDTAYRVLGHASATHANNPSSTDAPTARVGVHLQEMVGYRGAAKSMFDGSAVNLA